MLGLFVVDVKFILPVAHCLHLGWGVFRTEEEAHLKFASTLAPDACISVIARDLFPLCKSLR